MGDMNTKIGNNNDGMECLMGKEGAGKMNKKWSYACQFVMENNRIIGGSFSSTRKYIKLHGNLLIKIP